MMIRLQQRNDKLKDFISHEDTAFLKVILLQGMQEDFILHLDEVDAIQPEVSRIRTPRSMPVRWSP